MLHEGYSRRVRPRPPFALRGPRLHRAGVACLALLCLGAAFAFGAAPGKASSRGLVAELAREAASLPANEPRLSISSGVRPCTAVPRASALWGACVPAEAGGIRSTRVQDIGVRAAAGIAANADPGAMHAAALIDLLYDAAEGKTLQRSISFLQTASRLTDRPAPVLADLAAAYLVRAERARTPRDLLAAIEAAEQALEYEPRNPAALFNRALALHRFGLVEEAARDWGRYLAVDSSSAWAHAARRRLGEAVGVPAAAAAPGPQAPAAAYEAYAAAEPQGARVLGMCQLLGAWGQARLAGDAPAAEAHLRRAEILGRALGRRGGDATLSDAARAIRGRGGRGHARLARAHREFAAACSLDEQVEFRAAAPRFRAAHAEADGSPVLRAWARLMYGSMIFHTGDGPGGEVIFREVAGAADPDRHPALAGRARQLLAARLLRADRYDGGLREAHEAAGLFARAGERENEGAALDALSGLRFYLREMDAGYDAAHRALAVLAPYRSSYRLHNLLSFTAETVADDGFPRTAVRMQDEGVRVAERTGKPVYVAEARITRARLLAAVGELDGAERDIVVARAIVPALADPRARQWMTAQLQLARATTSLAAQPEQAGPALDSASAFLLEMHAPLLALPAVVGAAQARLAAGDAALAAIRLESALAILERRRESVRMEARRAAVFEAARGLVDRLAMLHLASGRTTEALVTLDRGRASLAAVGTAPRERDRSAGVQGPAGEIAIEYALVGDTLLAWTVDGSQVALSRTIVDTLRLARTVDQLLGMLERSAGEEELRPALSRLHEWLVRPVAGRLGGPGTPVVVIADGRLAAVPFAALHDPRRGTYLVEEHPLRFAVSLREARRRSAKPGVRAAVLVSDPAFDPMRYAGFERLRGAAQEVRDIALQYPRVRVLEGAAAHGGALREALGGAGVLHYAGHAVFDDERPERSYLLLAPAPAQGRPATLDAAAIAQMDLRGLSLVVLSACETVRTGPGRAAGFSGLAGAFLAAGAGGAVASLWEVDDGLTRPLMVEFHQAYRASGNGPAALRAAQVRLLRSGDKALRSPSAWAAFRYAGS